MMTRISYALVVTVAAVLLCACGSSEQEQPDVTKINRPKVVAKAQPNDPSAKMARAVVTGKSGAPVDLKYEFKGKPVAGTPTEVELAFVPTAPSEQLSITVAAPEGVTLAGALTATFKSLKPGESQQHSFSLMPQQDGMYYVTVTATTITAGVTEARTFSIPFIVGSLQAEQKPAAPPAQDTTGQPIQSMKAEESGK